VCVCRGFCGCVCVCVRLCPDSWRVPPRPGTSPGSPASVMTEDRRSAVTSCGSPGSEMCHQTGWSLAACRVFFLCVQQQQQQQTGWVERCPPLRARGKLREHYLLPIVGVRRSLAEILEGPQVSSARRPWPGRTRRDSLGSLYLSVSLSLSLSLSRAAFMCLCVHSPDPELTPPLHPCGHLPPPGSHTHYQSPLMASN